MTRHEFEKVFRIGQVVASGGSRRELRIDQIEDDWFSVIAVSGKLQRSQRMYFDKLDAVIRGFGEINPKRIEGTVRNVLLSRGLKKETKTETYLYGFARAYLAYTKTKSDALPEEIIDPADYIEGAKKTVIVNAYERDAAARAKCLKHYGTQCCVCQLDLGKRYGNIGEGYIHVHHLNPLAGRGGPYRLDPIKDLRPVCPNCHAMLHRTDPLLTPEQLRLRMSF